VGHVVYPVSSRE